jgi:hypothetical protein
MHLGTLIEHLSNESDAATALDALGNITLLAEVQAVGEAFDETPGEYVANAARRFAARAESEDWLALMSAMEYADEPGRAALERMIRWALNADKAPAVESKGHTCTCGGAAGDGHGCG